MGPGHGKQKSRTEKISIRDVPFLSFESFWLMVVHANTATTVQAGLLTFGSSYWAAPSRPKEQWSNAAFVPDYSGGPVPEFHGVPY